MFERSTGRSVSEPIGVHGSTVLEHRGISKIFGAITALPDFDLSVEIDEVIGLMGDNGAGNFILAKIIAGNFPPLACELRDHLLPAHETARFLPALSGERTARGYRPARHPDPNRPA